MPCQSCHHRPGSGKTFWGKRKANMEPEKKSLEVWRFLLKTIIFRFHVKFRGWYPFSHNHRGHCINYQPKLHAILKGKFIKITIHLYCFIPPRWKINLNERKLILEGTRFPLPWLWEEEWKLSHQWWIQFFVKKKSVHNFCFKSVVSSQKRKFDCERKSRSCDTSDGFNFLFKKICA